MKQRFTHVSTRNHTNYYLYAYSITVIYMLRSRKYQFSKNNFVRLRYMLSASFQSIVTFGFVVASISISKLPLQIAEIYSIIEIKKMKFYPSWCCKLVCSSRRIYTDQRGESAILHTSARWLTSRHLGVIYDYVIMLYTLTEYIWIES